MRYVPEQKWVVRLRAEWTQRSGHETTKQRIAVRSARPQACAALQTRHEALSNSNQSRERKQASFTVPSVIGAKTQDGILAIEWLRGDSLL